MSLARRMMASSSLGTLPGQAEFTLPGLYDFQVPAGVTSISAVGIAGGAVGRNVSPFNGGGGGGNHWLNNIPVTPLEWLTVRAGTSVTLANDAGESYIKRGSTFLVRAGPGAGFGSVAGGPTYFLTLGGGGGKGGDGGTGNDGNGGLGGGAGGYEGAGGKGGDYYDAANGQMPAVDSGGGRGADANGVPYGWTGNRGEGCGLLGRTPSFAPGSVGTKFGGGSIATGSADTGGLRIIWGGGRAYPDNVPDIANTVPATFVATANGTQNNSSPMPFTFHTSAVAGDLLLVWPTLIGSGSFAGFAGISNLNQVGSAYWKQITAADIAASLAGTTTILGDGNRSWVTALYRGPRVAVRRSVASDFPASDTVTVPGITKRIDCQRLVLTASDPDASASIPTPTGFTSRASRTTPLDMRLSDIAPADYTDGSSIVMTGMVATSGATAQLIELF